MQKILKLPFKYKKSLSRIAVLLLLLFSHSSCTDQGCIEADDFGEYQEEVLTIKANGMDDSCDYQFGDDFINAGSGIKPCLISGNTSVTDENNKTYTSQTGCTNLVASDNTTPAPSSAITLCISQCQQNCLSQNTINSSGSEPNWTSTSAKESGKNIGITLSPGSEIYIRAIGTVQLGGDVSIPNIRVNSTDYDLTLLKTDSSNFIYDVNNGKSNNIKFSGAWVDAIDKGNSTDVIVGSGSSNDYSTFEKAYNGARRLIAYIIPAPAGYAFDYNKTNEKDGTVGVPLTADTSLWRCIYTGNSLTESDCSSLSYKDNGYSRVNEDATNIYNITSKQRAENLGDIGGMIRWDNDGLVDYNSDPFAGITCNLSSCNGGAMPSAERGGIIGNQPDYSITNNNSYAVNLSFRSLSGNNSCDNPPITVTTNYTDLNGNQKTISNIINVSFSGWSNYIALEKGDKVAISGISNSCAKVVAYRMDKLQDITINKSGYISFRMLNDGVVAGSCSLNLRVINPRGSRVDQTANYTADFYEDDFERKINVTAGGWSDEVFLRKGQVLRFNSQSWNDTWGNLQRQCGIGTAMKIKERPAFLCRGTNPQEIVANPKCTPEIDDQGKPTGKCQAYSKKCFDQNSDSYCPNPDCQNNYTSSCNDTVGVTQNSCTNCFNAKTANGKLLPNLELNLIQCYDLENYYGKVANINPTTGFTDADLDDENISKGAKKLPFFNGNYGNFELFEDTEKLDSDYNNNHLYQTIKPMIYSQTGRLKFLILDGSDFNYEQNPDPLKPEGKDSYSANAATSGNSYYRVYLSGKQEFTNGQMLEAILCNSDGTDCSSLNPPASIPNQPLVVKIDPDSVNSPNLIYKSFFNFAPDGSIVRIDNDQNGLSPKPDLPVTNNTDGTVIKPGVPIGANYYMHFYQYLSEADQKLLTSAEQDARNAKIDKVRLTFKILDTDIGNCNKADPNNPAAPLDGIRTNNIFYDSTQSVPTKIYCDKSDNKIDPNTKKPVPCVKQFVCSSKYINNSGSYQLVVRIKNAKSSISNIVNSVINPVIEIIDGPKPNCSMNNPLAKNIRDFDGYLTVDSDGQSRCKTLPQGQAERIYKLVVNDSRYGAILNICLVVMLTFYGTGYLMGVSELSQTELISRTIKISTIYLFVSPQGWTWFNNFFVQFFKEGTNYLAFLMASSFDNSPELRAAIDNADYYDKSILFSSVDQVFTLFFSMAVVKKTSALLFTGVFGWAYLYIIYLSFMLYVYSVSTAILLYLTAQLFVSILFVLGPIFFLFLLFGQTKDMFDKWLTQLISFSLQQIFLLTTLAFFNMMMYEVLKMSLGYRVCWDDVWVINIVTRIKLLSFWTIASMPPRLNSQTGVGNVSAVSGVPSFFSILFIWVIASLMKEFITFMTDLAADIAGGLKASELGGGIKGAVGQLYDGLNKHAVEPVKFFLKSPMRAGDKFLFDSGEEAAKARRDQRQRNEKDLSIKSAMSKAGEKAVIDYKNKNAHKMANMTLSQQIKELEQVRTNAMVGKGMELGLDQNKAKALIESKVGYVGSNIAGAMKHAAKNRFSTGSFSGDMKDAKVDYRIDAEAALENLDSKERKELLKAAEDNKIKLKENSKRFTELGKYRMGMAIATLGASEAIGSGIASINRSRKIKNSQDIKSSDRNVAEDQLVAEGAIHPMLRGFGYFRSEAEKKLIEQRAKENRDKDRSQAIENTGRDLGYAKVDENIQSNLESGVESAHTRKKGWKRDIFGAKKTLSSYYQKVDEAKTLTPDEEQKSKESYRNQLLSEKASAEDVLRTSSAIRDAGITARDQLASSGKIAEMQNLQNQLKAAEDSKDAVAIRDINIRMSDLRRDDDYIKQYKDMEQSNSAAVAEQHEMDLAQAKLDDVNAKLALLPPAPASQNNQDLSGRNASVPTFVAAVPSAPPGPPPASPVIVTIPPGAPGSSAPPAVPGSGSDSDDKKGSS